MGGHQPARLVKQEQPGALARRQRLAVDGDDIVGGDIERRRIDDAAVDRDAALHDPFLGVAVKRSRLAALMLLPGTTGFTSVAVAIPARTFEFRTVLAGTVELRPLTERALALGTVSL